MAGRSRTSNREPVERVENRMRKVSLVISLLGLGLMSLGLIDMLVGGDAFLLPGPEAPPLASLMHIPSGPVGLMFASSGVILLGLLPAIRVMLALWLYLRLKDVFSVFVAVVVLLELLLSIHLSA